MRTFRTELPSAYASVAQARRAVGNFAQTCGFPAAEVADIVLAVGEACSNAVEHGHAPDGRLTVCARFDGLALSIEITDQGPGIAHAAATNETGPHVSFGRGRGIPIMRALMDGVIYKTSAGGTTVCLEKRLSARDGRETVGESSGVDAGGARQPR